VRKQDKFIIWPAYFDQSKTRNQGRKVPKNLALPAPRLDEIQKAAARLGFKPETVSDVAYSATPWLKTGMVMVEKKGSKLEIVRRIAKEVAVQRGKVQN
jgi:signal recognition particle subunit SRP19